MSNIWQYRKFKVLSALAYATPLGILFAVNHEAYLTSTSTGIGFFGYILIAFIVLGAKNKIQDFAKKNTVMTVSAIVFITAFIMQYLATQLLLISGVSLGGAVISSVIEPVADVYYAKSYEVVGEVRTKKQEFALPSKEAWRIAYGFRY